MPWRRFGSGHNAEIKPRSLLNSSKHYLTALIFTLIKNDEIHEAFVWSGGGLVTFVNVMHDDISGEMQ